MPIKLDTTIGQVGQSFAQGLRVGYTPQIDPGPFVRAYDSTIRAGQQLQGLGEEGARYVAAQQALHNDNLVNEAINLFNKEFNDVLIEAEYGVRSDPLDSDGDGKLKPGKLWAIEDIESNVRSRLSNKQQELLKKVPAIRHSSFLQKTFAKATAGRAKAQAIIATRVNKKARAVDMEFKNNLLDDAATLSDKEITDKAKEYQGRLARGVLAGVYDSDDAFKERDKFKEDLADTIQNEKTRKLFMGEFTWEQVQQRSDEILADKNLNPKEKANRSFNLIRQAGTIQRQRQTALEKQAKENSDKWIMKLTEKITDNRLNPTGKAGLTRQDLDEARPFIRNPTWLQKFEDIVEANEAQFQLGDEDDSPAQGYLNQIAELEYKAVTKNWTSAKLAKKVKELRDKVSTEFINDNLKKLNQKEMQAINSEIIRIVKEFDDDGLRNLKDAKAEAEKTLRYVLGGSDKAFDRFNSRRNELVSDAIEATNLLIEKGMDADKAVEKIRTLVVINDDDGISAFKADQFETMLEKAITGKLTVDERYLLGALVARRRKRLANPK